MSHEFYILMILAYLATLTVSAFAGYGAGERGDDGSKDMSTWCVYSTLTGMGIALVILILDTHVTERAFGLKVFFWLGAMLIAALMSTWARRAGYKQYTAKNPYLA